MTTRALGFALLFILVLAPSALAAQEQGSWRRLPTAPIAPDSPQCSWTMISGVWPCARKLDRMKSTSALTTAMLFCVPP